MKLLCLIIPDKIKDINPYYYKFKEGNSLDKLGSKCKMDEVHVPGISFFLNAPMYQYFLFRKINENYIPIISILMR